MRMLEGIEKSNDKMFIGIILVCSCILNGFAVDGGEWVFEHTEIDFHFSVIAGGSILDSDLDPIHHPGSFGFHGDIGFPSAFPVHLSLAIIWHNDFDDVKKQYPTQSNITETSFGLRKYFIDYEDFEHNEFTPFIGIGRSYLDLKIKDDDSIVFEDKTDGTYAEIGFLATPESEMPVYLGLVYRHLFDGHYRDNNEVLEADYDMFAMFIGVNW